MTAEFFDRMIAVNLRAPFLHLAALTEHLDDGASVVVTSSTATYEDSPMATVYAATRGALAAAARGWAAPANTQRRRPHQTVSQIKVKFR